MLSTKCKKESGGHKNLLPFNLYFVVQLESLMTIGGQRTYTLMKTNLVSIINDSLQLSNADRIDCVKIIDQSSSSCVHVPCTK